jgi:hypothetical protein
MTDQIPGESLRGLMDKGSDGGDSIVFGFWFASKTVSSHIPFKAPTPIAIGPGQIWCAMHLVEFAATF